MRPGRLLEEALRELGTAAARLAAAPPLARRPRPVPGGGVARPGRLRRRGPRASWEAVRSGAAPGLDPRAVRYLCWEPDVALDPAFVAHLDAAAGDLDARLVRGLLRGCHRRWSPAVAAGPLAAWLRARITRLAAGGAGGRLGDRLAARWRRDLDLLLGPDGAQRLAERLVTGREPVERACRGLAIDPRTPYVRAAVRLATRRCRERLADAPDAAAALFGRLLPWPGWEAGPFRAEVAATVLGLAGTPAAARAAGLRFVLDDPRLGDPRQSAHAGRWQGMAEARRRVVAWLADADLGFFFETVVPAGDGPGPRWIFWQRYREAIGVSRVLLCPEDELRWEERRRAGATGPVFGTVGGGDSALVLGFRRVLAVEHARGRAVDLLARRDDDTWLDRLGGDGLDALARPRVRVARVALGGAWEDGLARALAAHGTIARAGAASARAGA